MSINARQVQAAIGSQKFLRITDVSTPALYSYKNQKLIKDVTVLPIGVYTCAIDSQGMSSIDCHVLMTAAGSGAASTALYTTYMDGTQKDAGTGTGALVATTSQKSTVALKGEQQVKLVITVTAQATFSRGESNGL